MINLSLLSVFIPTFFFVSITPGMCMTLSLTLGMAIGVRRTLWMMWGELLGVAVVSIAAVIGVAALMLHYPSLFQALKYGGGAYLFFLGIQLWRSKGKMAISHDDEQCAATRKALALQGFITAIANPKAWAFMVSLLPPFIDSSLALVPQVSALLSIILLIEFACLILYASGGKTLRRFLQQRGNVRLMNRFAGTLMMAVGGWLAFL